MNKVWNPSSSRFAHSITRYAVAAGLKPEHAGHVTAKILAEIRKDVADNGATTAETEGKNGAVKQHEVKKHDVKQRATGAKLLKLTWGTKEELFVDACSALTQAYVRQDQALASLEALGAGMDSIPPVGSIIERHWNGAVVAVKNSFAASYAPKSVEQAAAEAAMLA